jgi:hypothetical protein
MYTINAGLDDSLMISSIDLFPESGTPKDETTVHLCLVAKYPIMIRIVPTTSNFVILVPRNHAEKMMLNIRLTDPRGASIIGEIKPRAQTLPKTWVSIYSAKP